MKNRTLKSFSKAQHSFSVVESGVTRQRSAFDRPSRTTTSLDGGWLIPILIDEVLPGDTFQLQCQTKGWLATPLVPFLDNLYLDTFFFFVPNRLVWENWQRFQGEKDSPGDSTSYTVPQMEIAGGSTPGAGKLADYMGIPTIATTYEVNAMPFRGYNLIYNEFFRDQSLQDAVTVDIDDANSTESSYVVLKRGRRKDYLSGCLPWPQRGTTEPGVISGVVPIVSTGDDIRIEDQSGNETILKMDGAVGIQQTGVPNTLDTNEDLIFGSVTGLEADMSLAQANTINQLRQSIAIQQLLELDARGGTRYIEQLKARWGVTSADHRLQRPEYLGGGHNNISVTPVAATNQSANVDQGSLAGFGHIDASGGGFTHSFTEHGFIIGIASVRADYTYFEGVPRHWARETRYDYCEPSLCHIGEQAVYNSEIFVSNDANDDLVWGYQERFAEYKYGNSMVTAYMRPNHPAPLSFWTLAQQFTTLPTLGDTFIKENPPIDRVIRNDSEPHLLLDCYFQNRCTRVMPVFNTPGLTRL